MFPFREENVEMFLDIVTNIDTRNLLTNVIQTYVK